AFYRLDRQRIERSGQAAERARSYPLLSSVGNYLGGAIKLVGFQKVARGLLQIPAAQKEIGYLRVFGHHSGPTDLRKQPAAQKILVERMQAVLFAAPVSGERDEYVAGEPLRQNSRAVLIRREPRTDGQLYAGSQGETGTHVSGAFL